MTAAAGASPEQPPADSAERLDSWKEIAAYFQRDVRTVRRWERAEALPVHRHRHRARGSVYAYKSELDVWFTSRRQSSNGQNEQAPVLPARRAKLAVWFCVVTVLSLAAALWVGIRISRPQASARLLPIAVLPSSGPGDDRAHPAGNGRSTSAIDPQAYDLYLKARYHLSRRTGQVPLARRYLEEALSRAPDFAPAHAALADAFARIARRADAEQDAWARAEASARKALALDERLPLAYAVLATIALFRDWNWTAADAAARRAVTLDARDVDACNAYAIVLRAAGLMDQAIAQRSRSLATDPVNVILINQLGADYVFARRFQDAIREFRRALELEPNSPMALDGLADACARAGLDGEAAIRRAKFLRLQDSDLADQFERLSRRAGYRAAEHWLLQRNVAQYSQNPTRNAWNLAFTCARLGDKEQALRWLEEAIAHRDAGLLQMAVDPDVDSLRADPRFKLLQGRVGLK